jgi:hypothetical protein
MLQLDPITIVGKSHRPPMISVSWRNFDEARPLRWSRTIEGHVFDASLGNQATISGYWELLSHARVAGESVGGSQGREQLTPIPYEGLGSSPKSARSAL